VTNESNSIPIEQSQSGANKSSTTNETNSLPIVEGWGRVLGGVTKGTGGRKPGYITANPYTYPIIKDYR
jgi:hypothetical protein